MDDPWGSPWAEEEEQHQQPINIKGSDGGSVTTQTPAKTATLVLDGKINSPWDNDEEDDDDGFGDWASVPTKADGEGNPEIDAPDEVWHRNAREDGELATDHAKGLSPIWKDNTILSDPPKLAPSPMPKHSMRQPSPDPWATEFTLNNRLSKEEDEEQEGEEDTAYELRFQEIQGRDSLPTASDDRISLSTSTSQSENDLQSEKGKGSHEESVHVKEEDAAPQVAAEQTREVKRNSTTEVDRLSSRPSSSPSDGSQREDVTHESPRTSMDDDPKRPQLPRTVSTKTQKLVEHSDGLAKQEDEEPPINSRETSLVRNQRKDSEDGTDDFGDFADFDEAASDSEESTNEDARVPESPRTVSDISTPAVEPSTPKTPRTPQNLTTPNYTPKKFYGPVQIDVDLSILDELFPNEKSEPAEKIFIPDTVPHDSFSSTEERKTWYRISRYGTMIKHNSGDDENYVRVTWSKSTMRDDTLKIVARWMEEDRLSGQVILGGGGKTSALFGWGDSKAPPVSLSSAFAPKETKKIPKAPEVVLPIEPGLIRPTLPISPRQKKHVKPAQGSQETKTMPLSPVANFGWNSSLESKPGGSPHMPPPPRLSTMITPPPTTQIPSPIRTSTSSVRPITIQETIKSVEPVSIFDEQSNLSTHDLANTSHAITPSVAADIEDDDDDWGDMVSSPNVTSPQEFPPSSGEAPMKSHDTLDAMPKNPSTALGNQDSSIVPSPGHNSSSGPPVEALISTPVNQIKASAPVPSTGSDPWASADFSFFDASPALLTNPAPASVPLAKPNPQKSVTFSDLPAPQTTHSRKLPLPQASQPNQKAREEAEQDSLVQSIIKNLPDLSYMLRR